MSDRNVGERQTSDRFASVLIDEGRSNIRADRNVRIFKTARVYRIKANRIDHRFDSNLRRLHFVANTDVHVDGCRSGNVLFWNEKQPASERLLNSEIPVASARIQTSLAECTANRKA